VASRYVGLVVPQPATLKRYGLSLAAWKRMARFWNGKCWVCHVVPKSGRLVVDHEHAPGWKKMPPKKRVLYVRGLCCTICNHYILSRWATPKKLRGAAEYLETYEARKS